MLPHIKFLYNGYITYLKDGMTFKCVDLFHMNETIGQLD